MPDATSTPWLQLMSELRNFLSGGSSSDPRYEGLQILPVGLPAQWDNSEHGKFIGWEQWANAIPKWDPVYAPNVSHRFDDNYHSFLLSFDIPAPDPVIQKAVNDDIAALAKTAPDILQVRITMGTDWMNFDKQQREALPQSEWLSFDDWYLQSGYPEEMSQKQTIYDAQLGKFGADAEKANSPLATQIGEALTRYNNRDYQQVTVDDNGIKILNRVWELSPDLTTWVQEAVNGHGTSLDLTVDNTTSTSVSSSFSVDGSVGFSLGIFGVAAEGGYKRQTIDTTSADFKMEIQAPAFGGIVVAPGPWYMGSAVELLKDGPYKPGFSKDTYFGKDGVLNLLPTILYLMYQPTITLKMTASDYDEVSSETSGGAEFSIGPFNFGGNAGGANDKVTQSQITHTLTIASHSPDPMVVAVLSSVMPV